MHVDGGLACVAAGVPVIVEKPIADTVEGATRLVEAGEKTDVPVLTGHHRQHGPIMAKAREIIQSGVLGPIVAVVGTTLFHEPDDYYDVGGGWRREPGGGPILLNLIHEVNNLQSLVGDIVSVQAVTSNATRSACRDGQPVPVTDVRRTARAASAVVRAATSTPRDTRSSEITSTVTTCGRTSLSRSARTTPTASP
jgi:predicted dehydrogenase